MIVHVAFIWQIEPIIAHGQWGELERETTSQSCGGDGMPPKVTSNQEPKPCITPGARGGNTASHLSAGSKYTQQLAACVSQNLRIRFTLEGNSRH